MRNELVVLNIFGLYEVKFFIAGGIYFIMS